jgi:hypothetical protein
MPFAHSASKKFSWCFEMLVARVKCKPTYSCNCNRTEAVVTPFYSLISQFIWTRHVGRQPSQRHRHRAAAQQRQQPGTRGG